MEKLTIEEELPLETKILWTRILMMRISRQ